MTAHVLNHVTSRLTLSEMGGAFVRKRFVQGDVVRAVGSRLTVADLAAIPAANRDALVKNLYIEPFPAAPIGVQDVILVSRGFGKFDVVEGRRINTDPLTREEADALIAKIKPATEGQVAA